MKVEIVSEKDVVAWLVNLFVNTLSINGYDTQAAKQEVVKRYNRSEQFDVEELLKFEKFANDYSSEDIKKLKELMEEY